MTITEIWNSHFAEILNTPNPRPRKDLNLFHVCANYEQQEKEEENERGFDSDTQRHCE